jgi:hypothetical protein
VVIVLRRCRGDFGKRPASLTATVTRGAFAVRVVNQN